MAFMLQLIAMIMAMLNKKADEFGAAAVEALDLNALRTTLKGACALAVSLVKLTATTVDDTLAAIGLYLVSDDGLWALLIELSDTKLKFGAGSVEDKSAETRLIRALNTKFGAIDVNAIMQLIAAIIALIQKIKPKPVPVPVPTPGPVITK